MSTSSGKHNVLTRWEVVEDITACLADAPAETIAEVTAAADCGAELKKAGNLHKILQGSSPQAIEKAFNIMARALRLPMSVSMEQSHHSPGYLLTYHTTER